MRPVLEAEWTDGCEGEWAGPIDKRADTESTTPVDADEETFRRLAALPPLEYDRQRAKAAERLGCRASTLDELIQAHRPRSNEELQGRAMELPDVELWPECVNGADVLTEIAETFSNYVALPDGAPDVCALWCAHTHGFRVFSCSPRLHVTAPEKNCGKTTTRDVVSLFVPRPLPAENLSVAVLFRVVEKHRPTILADECDTWLRDNEELRGMLNAGHRRGGQALRCEGDANEVRAFNVFAPVVLCGIGTLPGTLHDRSIVIRLERAKPGELSKRFDPHRGVESEKELCRKLARFVTDNTARLEACDPKLPAGAFNRLADNWRPLFAIAEIAGSDWPQRVTAAFMKLTSTDDMAAEGIGTTLLADIRQLFKKASVDKLPSAEVCESLAKLEDREWAEWGRARKPISTHQLAKLLRRFRISPRVIRVGDETARGYLLADFTEAFERYLSPEYPFSDCNSITESEFYL